MPRFFIRIEAEDHRQGAPPQHIGGEGRWVRTWTEKVWADWPEAALEVAEHQARERTGNLDCKAVQVASAPEVEARFWQGTRPREEQAEAETLALQTNALAGQNRKGPRRLVIRALPDPDTDGPAGEDRP